LAQGLFALLWLAVLFTAPTVKAADTIWFDDAPPAGASLAGDGEGWNWVGSNPAPYSGALAHQSALVNGIHQHYFFNANAASRLAVGAGDTLFAYVYLDPVNPPTEVMLQWNDGNWEHRAYWGLNSISWGVDGTASRRYMGALPPTGQWVRLEVPAALVGLEGRSLNGMAFTLFNGRATWDLAGKAAAQGTSVTVSGTVTANGLALSGVALAASNGGVCTGTNPSGQYSCTVPQNWSGSITPTLLGYTFTPASRSYSAVAANQTAQDYAASATTFQLSGTVSAGGSPLAGVVMTPSSGGACTATNAAGQYSCTVPFNWSGTVTPTLAGYTFTPTLRSYAGVLANQGAQDYGATAASVTVSGSVTAGGSALSGVGFAASNGGVCSPSNAAGQYSCTVPFNWSGSVTPALAGYEFTPAQRSYSGVTSAQAAQDYDASVAGASVQLSGTVSAGGAPLPGVAFAATNGSVCTTTNAAGQYGCTVPLNWSGTVTPMLAGYTFTPALRSYASIGTDQAGQDFAALSTVPDGPALVGASSAPVDGGSQTGPLASITPPSGMLAGDLVVLMVQARASANEDAFIVNTGGQVWSAFDATFRPGTGLYLRMYWARFNGTWTANPTVRSPAGVGGQPITLQMQAYRASDPGKWWVPDNWGYQGPGFAAPPFPHAASLPGITTLKPETVAVAAWATASANTWDTLSGAGWTQAGLLSQYRNASGAGQSLALAYQPRTSTGATGPVSLNQATGGGVPGAAYVVSFAAVDLPQGGAPTGPLTRVQSKSMQGGDGTSTLTLTLDAPVASGNALIGYVYFETESTRIVGPIVDDKGNEYTVVQAVDTTAVTQMGVTFFRPNITNAPRSITVTVTGTQGQLFRYAGMLAHEVSGALALDKYSGFSLPSGDAFNPVVISAGPVTTTADGAYIFCVAETVAQSPEIPFFDFSAWASARVVEEMRRSDSSNTFASGDTVQAVAGPIECTAAMSRGYQTFIMMMAFKPLP
jgi:hypothetical protein